MTNSLQTPDALTFAVARMLVSADWFTTAEEVLDYFDKPHRYQPEADLWIDAGRPSLDEPGWDLFAARLARLS